MTAADAIALQPLIALAVTAVVLLVTIALFRSHVVVAALCVAGLAITAALTAGAASAAPHVVGPLILDRFALYYTGLVALAAIAVALLAHDYLRRRHEQAEEVYVLLVVATLGAAVLASAADFIGLFLGLETLSVALYGLIAYLRLDPGGVEAGFKYLILAGASSALLLFGIGLIYLALGSMSFSALAAAPAHAVGGKSLVAAGLALVLVGLGFKLALVPFHVWTPDVYQGAPAPITAFLATVSKAGVLAALLRLYYVAGYWRSSQIALVVALVAGASMFTGNLLALRQRNVKRLLACSSIAHLGYIMVAFLAMSVAGVEAVTFYVTAYVITTLAAFGVVSYVARAQRGMDPPEPQSIDDYRGLAWRRPWTSAVFIASLLSLAGIPLTAGFLAKFYVLLAGAAASRWALVVILIVNSAIGLYYYLHLVGIMLLRPNGGRPHRVRRPLRSFGASEVVLAALTLLLLWLGLFPGPIQHLIAAAVTP